MAISKLTDDIQSYRKTLVTLKKLVNGTQKCDEARPLCGACQRHGVTCEYRDNYIQVRQNDRSQISATSHTRDSSSVTESHQNSMSSHHSTPQEEVNGQQSPVALQSNLGESRRLLELRLLHHFMAYTSQTWSPSGAELWSRTATGMGLSYEFLLAIIFAVAAAHLAKSDPSDQRMKDVSREYFQTALRGQSKALQNVHSQSHAEALFLTTSLVSFYAFSITPSDDDATGSAEAELFQWLSVAKGGSIVYRSCQPFYTSSEIMVQLIATGPDLTDNAGLFEPENRSELLHLLNWGTDYENISATDRDGYEKTLSYVGLIYILIRDGEDPLSTCRRVLALPSRVPYRFLELVEERRPRALVILAHLFASLKLVRAKLWWKEGIAELRVQAIYDMLPKAWKEMMELPMRIISGGVVDEATLEPVPRS